MKKTLFTLILFASLLLQACGGSDGAPGAPGATGATGPAGPGVTWITVTDSPIQAESSKGYLTDSASQVTITLPASPAVGDLVSVTGLGTGGWKIAQNAGQTVVTKNLLETYDASWTARALNTWRSVASSADGTKLAATAGMNMIYTSTDAGATWIPHIMPGDYRLLGGRNQARSRGDRRANLHLDRCGSELDRRESDRRWYSIASSADGIKLAAVVLGGQIYTSINGGATWDARESAREWSSVASSADGTKLAAAVDYGQIYTSSDAGATWTARMTDANRL